MTAIVKTQKFFKWFTRMGGTVNNQELEHVNKKLHYIPLRFGSSLKSRASEIKEKYNYKFVG